MVDLSGYVSDMSTEHDTSSVQEQLHLSAAAQLTVPVKLLCKCSFNLWTVNLNFLLQRCDHKLLYMDFTPLIY